MKSALKYTLAILFATLLPTGFAHASGMERFWLTKDLKNDRAIIEDKSGAQYLIEYGLGCSLSIWRYEGSLSKKLYIDVGGSFLDGIGDRMYLLDDDRDCKIWDADELDSGSSHSSAAQNAYLLYLLHQQNSAACPANATRQSDGKCYCNSGFDIDSTKAFCIQKTCQLNSELIGGTCTCNTGYVLNSNTCISHDDDCRNTFGSNVVGQKGDVGNSSCFCAQGFEWNSTKTSCVTKLTCPDNSVAVNGKCECIAFYQPTQDGNRCVAIPSQTIQQIPPSQSGLSAPPADNQLPGSQQVIAKQAVNVRVSPKLNGKIVGVAVKNKTYTILGEQNGWYKIEIKPKKVGWSLSKYYRLAQ